MVSPEALPREALLALVKEQQAQIEGLLATLDGPPKKPTRAQMQKMVSNVSMYLRDGNIRYAQHEAKKLYTVLYTMGLLPELSE